MDLELSILEYNYWEHFKHAKDISLILPRDNHKRIEIEKSLNELQGKINIIKNKKNGERKV